MRIQSVVLLLKTIEVVISQSIDQSQMRQPVNENIVYEIDDMSEEYVIYQTNENMTFLLPFINNSPRVPEYYHIEVYKDIQVKQNLNDQYYILLLYNQTMPPQKFISSANQMKIVADLIDYNGYYLRKDYLHIIINTKAIIFNSAEPQYLTILIPQYSDMKYTLTFSASNFKPCANDCRNHLGDKLGTCYDGYCQCRDGFIDEDCSQSATELKLNNAHDYLLYQETKLYFYYEPESQFKGTVQLEASIDGPGKIIILLKIEDSGQSALPVLQDYSDLGTISGVESYKVSIMTEYFQIIPELRRQTALIFYASKRRQRLIISFIQQQDYFNGNIKGNIKIFTYSEEDPQDPIMIVIYFLIGLAMLLLITWIIIMVVRYKNRNEAVINHNLTFHLASSNSTTKEQCPLEQGSQQQCQHFDQRRFRQIPSNSRLQTNLKQIRVIYQNINSQFRKDTQCSVCLEEFLENQIFRTTPCSHVFHQHCIEQWLERHENCPNCRLSLLKKDIEVYLIQEQKNKEQSQRNADNNFLNVSAPQNNIDLHYHYPPVAEYQTETNGQQPQQQKNQTQKVLIQQRKSSVSMRRQESNREINQNQNHIPMSQNQEEDRLVAEQQQNAQQHQLESHIVNRIVNDEGQANPIQ